MALLKDTTLKNLGKSVMNSVSEVLSNSDFISRTIGMQDTYDDLMFIIQALGREPVSLLGQDYPFIFDHVRRNYMQGTYVMNSEYDCPKFTFYKEMPTVRFADPYTDPNFLIDRWFPDMTFSDVHGENMSRHYSESLGQDDTNNIKIGFKAANSGTRTGLIESYGPSFGSMGLKSCDLVKKTNDNFNHGKYKTLIARFHTNAEETKDPNDPTQTAISKNFGMSHGRNLLKLSPTIENGYDNPYCRVWTYHHQYHTINDAIRPFDADGTTSEKMGINGVFGDELDGSNIISFRTMSGGSFDNGNDRLYKLGVLNYNNGFVNIAPTAKISDYFEDKIDERSDDNKFSIKKCMFSIENLAWKDTKNSKYGEFEATGLSAEQKGPLGGRIMWFPPYNITFSESVSVNWNNNQFIGRGEGVYTYTNTERRGALSFTLLIDHPSIVDYWAGRKKADESEKDGGLFDTKVDKDGVDDKYGNEQTLLRFFAGCDILMPSPQKYKTKTVEIQPEEKKEEPPQPTPQEPDEVKPKSKVLYCLLYYPNNYSGVDDTPNGSNPVVNAVDYLMNGIGTQKCVDPNTKLATDFMVDKYKNVEYGGAKFGGYEVREVTGNISIASEPLDADYEKIKKTYADLLSNEKKAQKLTNNNGDDIVIKYGSDGKSYTLAKQIGSEAMSLGSAKGTNAGGVSNYVAKSPYLWYRKRWYYRVDKDTENQKLTLPSPTSRQGNYIDTASFAYNGMGYLDKGDYLKSAFGIKYDDEDHEIVSFADMYVGLENDANVNTVMSNCYDDNRVKTLVRPFIDDKDHIKVTKVTFYGHASVQGNNASDEVNKTRNNKLAKNRALTFKKWMVSKGFPGAENAEISYVNGVQTTGNKNDVNDRITKIWRSASVVIEYEDSTVENAATAENINVYQLKKADGEDYGVMTDEVTGEPLAEVNRVEIPNKETSLTPELVKEMTSMATAHLRKNPNNVANDGEDAKPASSGVTIEEERIVHRYDNEGEFFKVLERDEPFLHHLITDKIKYFDPAFHSISPEGFNARLTFLHQCTRQGSTVENSAFESGTAYNLAFGRPPVCVLRLGDFYYTKIIINGLNINYEQPQWDLNPEGIGVMPMFANITIDFTFLGGSDLAGPIARLQNAVSFNYYANTGVYDNRAEMVRYKPDKSGVEDAFRGYRYPAARPVTIIENVEITDSHNYDTGKQTGWEGTTYDKNGKIINK